MSEKKILEIEFKIVTFTALYADVLFYRIENYIQYFFLFFFFNPNYFY